MRRKTLFQLIAVLLLLNVATLFLWQTETGSGIKKIHTDGVDLQENTEVAKVGSHSIEYHDWIDRLQDVHGKNELKELVNKELVKQAREEKDIVIDEKIIERDIALLSTMQHEKTEEEVEKSKERWREEIIYRYTLEALLTEDLSIDEDKVQSYYDTYKRQYNFSETFQLSHIIVQTMEEAEQIVEELEQDAPFELLAQEHSIDEDTKNKGGYLGHLTSNSQFMPEGYVEQALELDHFSYSEPFQTNRGIIILYLHEYYPSYTFTYEEIKPYIERELLLKNADEQLDATDLWKTYDAEWIYE